MASSNPSINSLKQLLMAGDDEDKGFIGKAKGLLGPDEGPPSSHEAESHGNANVGEGDQGLNLDSLLNTGPGGTSEIPGLGENATAEIPLLGPNELIPSSSENGEIDQNSFANVFYNGSVMTTIFANMFKTRN
jgi:hypothetical protein